MINGDETDLTCTAGKGCNLVQPLRKSLWRFLKNLETDLPYDPVIPFLGIYQKDSITYYSSMFIAVLFIIAKIGNNLTVHLRMNVQWRCDIYTQWHNFQLLKMMKFTCKWIELEKSILNELLQTQKDKHSIFSHSWMLVSNIIYACFNLKIQR